MDERKSAGLAGLLNGICPGLGYLYVGKPMFAFLLPITMLFLLGVFARSKLMFSPLGFGLTVVLVLSVFIFGVVSAAILVGRSKVTESKWFQSWYGYLGFLTIMFVINSFSIEMRGLLFGYETHRIASHSMKHTLWPGDYIFSSTLDFDDRSPLRGEVVVFSVPGNSSVKYVKRVIGIPGDVIEIKDSEVQINGEVSQENYINQDRSYPRKLESMRLVLSEDSYFLLGDNRDKSRDSRDFGAISKNHIYGSVRFIWFSFHSGKGVQIDRIGQRLNIN